MNKDYLYLFGPVPSRRLGRSLGIDLIPDKTCSLDCVYCECGRTTALTQERREYVPIEDIKRELDHFLCHDPNIDIITFAGSGEPGLNTGVGALLSYIKTKYPRYKTALLTNSTPFTDASFREVSCQFDYVLPSYDAASQAVFEKINRPAPGLTADMVSENLILFSHAFNGNLWVEVFIIPGINDTTEELAQIKAVLQKMKCTRVQLNSLDRPGTCSWVTPASAETLAKIAETFKPLPVEIISRKATFSYTESALVLSAEKIINLLNRRPMTLEDLACSLGKNINEISASLAPLLADKRITAAPLNNQQFYHTIT